MTSFTITAASSTAQTLAAGETGFITQNGSLVTTDDAITLDHSALPGTNTIGILGVAASTTRNAIDSVTLIDTMALTVGTQGAVIASAGFTTIELLLQSRVTLSNAGLISGGNALDISGTTGTQSAFLTNSGVIAGIGSFASTIVFNSTFEDVVLVNSGTISNVAELRILLHNSDIGVLDITNSGQMITNSGEAIRTNGRLELSNTGTITGSVTFAENATIHNTGTIRGGLQDIASTGTTEIENHGLITGVLTLLLDGSIRIVNSGQIGQNVFHDAIAVNGSATGSIRLDNLGGTINGDVRLLGAGSLLNSGIIRGDVIFGQGSNLYDGRGGQVLGTIFGGSAADEFRIDRSDTVIESGGGIDTVFSSVSYVLKSDTENLDLTGDLGLTGIGSVRDNQITAGAGNDRLEGRKGNDTLDGGEGNDLLLGGAGDDRLVLSDGTDTLNGGAGNDEVRGQNASYDYIINLNQNTATGTDRATGVVEAIGVLAGIENATGSSGDDNFVGSRLANRLNGASGNDTLNGFDGADTLVGSFGDDSLLGAKDDDVLIGGAGRDTLAGGAGRDSFVFEAVSDAAFGLADLIQGFVAADDRIDLAGLDADPLSGGDQGFAFVGTSAFAGPAPQVRFVQDAGSNTTTVLAQLSGQASPAFELVLDGLVNLTALNFDL